LLIIDCHSDTKFGDRHLKNIGEVV